LNANGLQQHKEEVKLFLKQNLIDILLISETDFTNKNHFNIPGYDICYTCHPDGTAQGDTAIIIKYTLEYYERPKHAEPTIQATPITVSGLFYKITIAAVYCPPRHNLKEGHFKAFFQTLGPRFLTGGDFNSKHTLWGSRLTSKKGRELAKLLQANNSFLSAGSPTYWPTDTNKTPDLLDFFITNGISKNDHHLRLFIVPPILIFLLGFTEYFCHVRLYIYTYIYPFQNFTAFFRQVQSGDTNS